MKIKLKTGFTLAEILITLGIIGIVAAMTIPTLINNIQKTQYVAGLKKAYSTIQQGFKLYMADQGVTDLSQTDLFKSNPDDPGPHGNLNIMIRKYFKVIKVCRIGDASCNIKGTSLNFPLFDPSYEFGSNLTSNPSNYNFCLADGSCFSINLSIQSFCTPYYPAPSKIKASCASISIDINGKQPPNKNGRDFFGGWTLAPDGNLYPLYGQDYAQYNSNSATNWKGRNYYWRDAGLSNNCGNDASLIGYGCAARIIENGWEMDY